MSRLEILEVVPGIWSVRRGRAASVSYILKTSPGAILVDAGRDPSGADVMMGLQKARVGLGSVRAILLTHAHPHAAAGAAKLRERSGARLLASKREAAAIGVPPDGFLDEGDVVESHLEVVATPGHSPGHLSFLLRRACVLFAGAALIAGGKGVEIAPEAAEPEIAWESVAKCLSLPVEIALPSYGPPLPASLLSASRAR